MEEKKKVIAKTFLSLNHHKMKEKVRKKEGKKRKEVQEKREVEMLMQWDLLELGYVYFSLIYSFVI